MKREHWSSRLGFILAAAGSAIGLGTMWMLPYVVGQNGGGAFILVFLIFLLGLGLPLFVGELLLGRQTQKSVVLAFTHYSKDSSWALMGWMGVVCTYLVAGWYCVVSGWTLHYLLLSLADAFQSKTPEQIGLIFDLFLRSGDIKVFWQFLFIAIVSFILYQGVAKGIEHYSRIFTSALFVLLVLLAVYSATLPGFSKGLEYILYPNFELLNQGSILKALTLALFTLSLGEGIMVTYGSYMKRGDDIPKTAFIVTLSIVLISILTALMIFPMVFTLGLAPASGEGLVFKTLPYVFEQLPGSLLLSALFFVLLFFAALTSAIGQMEVIVSNWMDLKGWSRQKAILLTSALIFILGLPSAWSGTVLDPYPHWALIFKKSFLETNYVVIDWMLLVFSLFLAIFVGFKMPEKERYEGFSSGSGFKLLYPVWRFLLRYIVPFAIICVILKRVGLI